MRQDLFGKWRTLLTAVVAANLTAARPALWFRLLTLPLALLYRSLVALKNFAYDHGLILPHRLKGRVIAIGNITAGGSGKSPVTIYLAEHLLGKGAKPAILARGYGSLSSKADVIILKNGKVLYASTPDLRPNDEGMMQSQALPDVAVVLGPERMHAASILLARFPELSPTHWLLDDGYQHRRIARDVNILLLDANSPFGNGRLLPSGNLREPLPAVARADVVLVTRAHDLKAAGSHLMRFPLAPRQSMAFIGFTNAPLQEVSSATEFSPSEHAPVLIVAGLANNQRFVHDIAKMNIPVGASWFLRDHQRLDPLEFPQRLNSCRSVVTTAKDYWRQPQDFALSKVPVFISPLVLNVLSDAKGWLGIIDLCLGPAGKSDPS